MNETEEERLKGIRRHIEHVQSDCLTLGERLIEDGQDELGLQLIANGYIHDNSKFSGIEWLYLHDDVKETNPEYFKLAVLAHCSNNPHHPEYWRGISNMPEVFLAEFVADTHSRASEFGTDFREWLKDTATRRFKMTTQSAVYRVIKGYTDLLLESPFK